VLFGVIAIVWPGPTVAVLGAGILALIWVLGAWLIVLGVILIALAASLRQIAHAPSTAGVA